MISRTQDECGQTNLQPVQSIEASIELSYYSNMLTPHFALQSVLMITFHELLSINEKSSKTVSSHLVTKNILSTLLFFLPLQDTEMDNMPGISRKNLIDAALANCDVLRYEFILHKPTQILSNLLEINLDELIVNDLIKLLEVGFVKCCLNCN